MFNFLSLYTYSSVFDAGSKQTDIQIKTVYFRTLHLIIVIYVNLICGLCNVC